MQYICTTRDDDDTNVIGESTHDVANATNALIAHCHVCELHDTNDSTSFEFMLDTTIPHYRTALEMLDDPASTRAATIKHDDLSMTTTIRRVKA